MGRENINPIVFQSSIALLQERFRQLQRMKEMREERELRRKLAKPKECIPTALAYEPSTSTSTSRLFFQFLPPRSAAPTTHAHQLPLSSLWLSSQSNKYCSSADFQMMEAPLLASLLPTITETPNLNHVSSDCDCDDVDTSLHL